MSSQVTAAASLMGSPMTTLQAHTNAARLTQVSGKHTQHVKKKMLFLVNKVVGQCM